MSLNQQGSRGSKALTVVLLLALFFGLSASCALAATTGSISGTVHDAQGAVLTGTTVTLRDTLTGVAQTITADESGFYRFSAIPLGRYEVTFEKQGFQKYTESGIVIDVDSQRRVDATLQVGNVQQQVTVTATQAAIETETQQMGEVIGSKEIEAVPLNGRNYTDLLALQPGVSPINVQWYNSAAPPNGGNDGALTISGGQDVHNGYYVNGANTVDLSGGGTFLTPVLDSIAEFRIVTNNAGAEYGGFSSGITNVVTKSGTNSFHGDAFEYLRNGSLNAKDYSLLGAEVGEPTLHQNIFGGTVGGPIVRNKVFFFADYQGLRNSDTHNADADIMSDAVRAGDMTEEAAAWSSNAKTVGSAYMASLLNQRMGRTDITKGEHYFQHTKNGVVDYDCNAPGNACVFPTGVIPAAALDPLAQNLIKTYLPHANETVNGKAHYFQSGTKQTWTENKGAGRVDATTRLGQVSGYFFYDPWKQFVPGAWGTTVPGFGQSAEGTSALAVASLTTPLGSSAVNNFVASWTYNRNINGNLPTQAATTLASLGWTTSGAQGGIVQITSGANQMVPSIPGYNIGPVTGGGAGTTASQFNNDYQGADNFSKVYKTHTLKVGAQYHWDLISIGKSQNASNGNFNIGNAETGLGDADFLLGVTSSFQQGAPYVEGLRNFYAAAYGEDSWRATKDLTINFGLRWEVNPFWREEHNRCPMLVKGVQSTRFPLAPTGYVFPGDPGIPEHLANINWHDFAPRFGVAYTPDFGNNSVLRALFGDYGKSSIRAGYGLYYTNIEGYNTFNFSAGPFGLFQQVNNGTLEAPYFNRSSQTATQYFPLNTATYNYGAIGAGTYRTPTLNESSPYEEDVDFALQRQIGGKTVVQLAYVGTFGHHLDVVYDGNPGDPALGLYLSDPANVTDGNTFGNYGGEDGPKHTYHAVNGQTYVGTRQGFGSAFAGIGVNANVGNSVYHAFEATVRHNSERAMILAAYTWSKAIDDGSGRGAQIFPEAPKFFRGLSLGDEPQNLAVTYSYELPIDKFIHANERFTRGWKISGKTEATTGVPVWINEDDDNNLRGDFKNSAWGAQAGTDTPMLAPGNIKGDHNPRHGRPWFNTDLFSLEPYGHEGNSPRRFFHGPGINNTDLSMLKDVKVKESVSVTFRADFFNAWNHAQWNGEQVFQKTDITDGAPDFSSGVNTGGRFGLLGGANSMRVGQLTATLHF